MAKNLIIVESPSKSHTITKYLGNKYEVVASMGHIRDLATTGKYGLGVDIENNFKPTYEDIPGKKKVIKDLKKKADEAEHVYLATDPDREGEAISWHLKNALGLKDEDYSRVLFHEITKTKVQEGLENPSKIDEEMVNSQETRRILDRIIGFRLSKLMQSKTGGKSAGRVQSVALKLIVDREREIEAFIPEEYWTITAHFKDYDAELSTYKDKKIELHNEEEANKVLKELSEDYKISNIEKKDKLRQSHPPFITSTMQQDASNKLGFPAKKTMSVAQSLYEGKDIGSETVGLITYMRTDSIRLSNDYISAAYKKIESKYGKEYLGAVKKSKEKENVQDAHEAIRPTSVDRTPESIKEYLTNDEYKLYNLIYYRTLASLMAPAKFEATTVTLNNNDYGFKVTGSVLKFDGYLKVYSDYESSEDKVIPDFTKLPDPQKTKDVESKQHFTSPPARYTEAKLIHELESLGIGRPSTYATIIDTIKAREYVKLDDKKFYPTEIGCETTDKLQEFFSGIINVKYTANMESDLDKIAEGEEKELDVLNNFYKDFAPLVTKAFHEMEKKGPEETGDVCPECGSPLVIRKSKYGEFVACSNYPKCKYVQKEEKDKPKEVCKCLSCGSPIVERKTKKGKIFYGCSNYPKCDKAYWDKPTGDKCPECGEMLVIKNGNVCCSSCEYEK